MEADILADREEQVFLMEPLLLSETFRNREGLLDLVLSPLADLVRSMNCYYSNLY